METNQQRRRSQVDTLYRHYSQRILGFISSRVEDRADAENLALDVWLRIMENENDIKSETALPYLYKIAKNIVTDYYRQQYSRPKFDSSYDDWNEIAEPYTPHEALEAIELAKIERERVECLPPQRRIIYIMSRYEEKGVMDIADELSLSIRTVENHLRLGRHDVRCYMKQLA